MPIPRNTFSFFQKNISVTLKTRDEYCGGSERSDRSLDGPAEGCRRAYFAKNAAAPDYRNIPPQILSKYPARPCLVNSFKREQQYVKRDCLSTHWSGRLSPSLSSVNDCCRISDCEATRRAAVIGA